MECFLIGGISNISLMKTYKVIIEGTLVINTANVIVDILREKSFLYNNVNTEDFIKELMRNIWKLFGIGIIIDTSLPVDKQCEQLVEQLIIHKLLPLG